MAISTTVKNLVRVRALDRSKARRVTNKTPVNTVAKVLDINLGQVRKEIAHYPGIVVEGAGATLAADFAGVVATTGGAIASIPLPEKCIITTVRVKVTTGSTGAANYQVAVDTSATNAGSPTNLGSPTNAQTVQITAIAGDAGGVRAAGDFVNISGSASTAGLVGTVYVSYLAVP